jgi:hypothetical protein
LSGHRVSRCDSTPLTRRFLACDGTRKHYGEDRKF